MQTLTELGLDALAILDQSPAVTYVASLGPEPRLQFVSRAARTMLGYAPERFVDEPGFYTSLLDPDDVSTLADGMETALKFGSAVRDRRVKIASGAWRWIRDQFRIIHGNDGNPAYGVGTITDVTEERAARQALEARTAEYRVLADHSSDLISRVTIDGRFLYQSPSVKRLMGFSPEERHGQSSFAQIHQGDHPALAEAWRACLKTRRSQILRYRAFRADGNWATFEAALNPVVDPDTNKVIEFVIVSRDISERVDEEQRLEKARADLREQGEIYGLFARHGSDFFLRLSADGRMTHISASHERLLGRQVLLREGRLTDACYPADIGEARSAWRRMVEERAPAVFRCRIRHERGHLVWIEGNLTPVLSDDGTSVVEVIGVCRDVTGQIEAEQALAIAHARIAEQSELYDLFASRGSDIFLRFTVDGRALHVSPSHERILGGPTLVKDGRVAHMVHPDDLGLATEAFQTALETQQPVTYRHRYAHAEGGWVWLEVTLTPLVSLQGKVVEYIAIARDVGAQVAAEQAVEAARAEAEEKARQIQVLTDTTSDIFLRTRADGTSIYVSSAYCRVLGYPESELATVQVGQRVHEDDRAALAEAVRRLGRTKEPQNVCFRARHADGRWVWLDTRMSTVLDPTTGEIVESISVCRDISERMENDLRLAETRDALEQSRAQLQLVTDNMADIVTVVRPDGSVAYMSPSVQQVLGYSAAEMMAPDRPSTVHPDDAPITDAEISANRVGVVSPQLTYRVRHADGRYIWVERRARAIDKHDFGEGVVVLSVVRDVSAEVERSRQIAESDAALKRSNAQLNLVADNIVDVISLFRPDGTPAYMSRSASKVLGYSMAELHSMPRGQIVHADDRAIIFDEREANRRGEITPVLRYRVIHKDGRLIWLERRASAVHDHDFGPGVAVLSVISDVTSRVHQEFEIQTAWAALEESRVKLQTIMDNSIDVIAVFGADRRMEYLSRSAEQQSGYTVEEFFQGKAVLAHPEDLALVDAAVAREREGGEGETFRYRGVRKDGGIIWLERRAKKVFDSASGELRYIVTVTREISEQVKHEQDIAAANAELERAKIAAEAASVAKSQFLATMSHELRTPMTGVMGMLDLMNGTGLTGEQARYATLAYESADNLLVILNDILDLSKIEAGQMQIVAEPFSLRAEIGKVVSLLSPVADKKGNTLKLDLADSLADNLIGDGPRIRQVLFNLVGNAVKFTAEGQVTIAARESLDGPARRLRLEIIDTGTGIPASIQARLFRPFVQADSSASRKAGGTGLGLAISRSFIELMGGRIGCDSIDGKGSTFWLELPLVCAAPPVAAAPVQGPAGPRPRRRFDILVAEDHPVNQQLIAALLKREGHTVTMVANGQLALEAVQRRAFDLVLMDIQMPVMDGTTATRAIRALSTPAARIPIVAITANALRGDMESYLAAGMTGYVSKPIKIDALREAMESAVPFSSEGERLAG